MSVAPAGLVFDLQHYAVHDGPGIRTLVFLKGCPLRCRWCCNPESQAFVPELRHSRVRCKECGRCATVCPHHAVSPGPMFDRRLCLRCVERPCVEACVESALAISGERLAADEVVRRVAQDLDFYRNSGGGVTVSGGEPFAQPEFFTAILSGCRERGIATAVETCGHAPTESLVAAEPLIDLFLFDIKVVDAATHERLTGVGNDLILANLRALATRAAAKLTVRLPFIPGCTDDDANVEAVAALLVELGLRRLELQPFHTLGSFKYEELGRPLELETQPQPRDQEALKRAQQMLRARGLECEVG